MGDRLGDKNKKLTSRFIETINKPGKYYDSNFGLFLRVYASGSKNWVQRIKKMKKEIYYQMPTKLPVAISLMY